MLAVRVERFGGPEVLTVAEIDAPAPMSTEVLVEVYAAGVNPVDYKTRRGSGVAASVGAPPFVPGWDIAGVVVGCGYGVTRFRPGDRVFGMPRFPREAGAYAEYVTAPSLQLSRIPDGLGFEEAAAVPLAALTVWQSLEAAAVGDSDRVLVHGAAGGVGHIAVQLAAALGASVAATTRQSPDPPDEVDVALDLVAGAGTDVALRAVSHGGVLLAIADGATEQTKAEAKRRGVRVLEPLVEPDGRALDTIAQLIEDGALRPRVAAVLPLEGAAEAHRRLEAGGVGGKLVLAVRS
jgi:NADPH:quinone reductase-like Zn-dependent oxidoreductase